MIYILNTLITPINFDQVSEIRVKFRKISVEEAQNLLQKEKWESAVGHLSTAQVLGAILNMEIPCERKTIFVKPGDKCVHFFLKQRLGEGVVLNKEELEKLNFWLVLSEIE